MLTKKLTKHKLNATKTHRANQLPVVNVASFGMRQYIKVKLDR